MGFEPGVRLNCSVDPYSINLKKVTELTDEPLTCPQYDKYAIKYQHVFVFYVQNMYKING